MVCRTASGWSAPDTIRIEGGSFGFQIGAGETDLVFIVMNHHGVRGSDEGQVHPGRRRQRHGGASGPFGEAQTDALMRAEILSYSRSHGIFAGVSLEGSTLRPDHGDNRELYGRNVTQREILTRAGCGGPPSPVRSYAELSRYAPVKRVSNPIKEG